MQAPGKADEEDTIDTAETGPHPLDSASVLNAKSTLLELLGRAGVFRDEAEALIALVEAGAIADAHSRAGKAAAAPVEGGQPYGVGRRDGAQAVVDELARIAERTLERAIGPAVSGSAGGSARGRHPVGRVEVERAKVAVTPLYLAFSDASDLDPEESDEVLTAVLGTMSVVGRVGYAGQLEQFTESHRKQLAQLYAEYGPRSRIAVHSRYSLLHSPTSIAVLERLTAAPSALRAEWEHAELPPAWLEGLATAWRVSEAPPG
ncbi:hypothetical protein [Streptomyces sp. B1I3]|uniref:hypothetical protein n=1 Tax=Streptomyces sp. B1I3 TaxID=3042264 RepID=UPI002785251E|nr:hypothetical protein [Streptomyces sp. B1I3]MDQ0797956.1 hypothetical protein [Streptomyces sp. B1I3]